MGGGGSKYFIYKAKKDPFPAADLSNGLQPGLAMGCAACDLVIPKGLSSSTVTLTRAPDKLKDDGPIPSVFNPTNTIIIKPAAPFKGSFNSQIPNSYNAGDITFDQLQLFYGAPIRVKNSMADACLLVLSRDNRFALAIPVSATEDGTEPSTKFFSALSPGFGKISTNPPVEKTGYDPTTDPNIQEAWKKNESDKKTEVDNYIKYASGGHYDTETARKAREDAAKEAANYVPLTVSVSTGSDWSLSTLITGDSPYFTWVDTPMKLEDKEQYNEDPFFKVHHFQWSNAGLPPLRIIYFQDPAYILTSDFNQLKQTINARDPNEVIQSMGDNQFYHAGKPRCKNCAGAKKAAKSYTFAKMKDMQKWWDSPAVQWAFFFIVITIMFLIVSGLISYVNDNPNNIFAVVARGIRPPIVQR